MWLWGIRVRGGIRKVNSWSEWVLVKRRVRLRWRRDSYVDFEWSCLVWMSSGWEARVRSSFPTIFGDVGSWSLLSGRKIDFLSRKLFRFLASGDVDFGSRFLGSCGRPRVFGTGLRLNSRSPWEALLYI